MRIQEIERTPASSSDDWESNQRAKTIPGLVMVPGSDRYGYVFQTLNGKERLNLTGTDLTIKFYDTLAAGGILFMGYIYFRNIKFTPYQKAIQISNVALDNRYRGQGLGTMMYTTVLRMGYTIVADETQTPQARKLWVKLNNTPGVEVHGRVEVLHDDIDIENAVDEWEKKVIRANLRKLKNVGAVMIGNLDDYGDYVPFDFRVQPDKNDRELAARGFKLYSNNSAYDNEQDYFIYLYARWTGQ